MGTAMITMTNPRQANQIEKSLYADFLKAVRKT